MIIEGVTNSEHIAYLITIKLSDTPVFDSSTRANANAVDCNWDSEEFPIPGEWPSGLYRARIIGDSPANDDGSAPNLLFVVRAQKEVASNIICSIPFTTWYAYSPWFGKSLYDYNSCLTREGSEGPWVGKEANVSLNRPLTSKNQIFVDDINSNPFRDGAVEAISLASNAEYWLNIREGDFVRWLSRQSWFNVDYCSSIDLQQYPDILDPYQLFLSIGHDEYWSKQMRNTVEGFVARGGNAAFFSANTCWFEVSFDKDYRTMTCEKAGLTEDQVASGWADCIAYTGDPPQPVFTQSNWFYRPENSMTGVSFRHGAENQWGTCNQSYGYKVIDSTHWAFEGTGLKTDEAFGGPENIVGYEVDAYCPRLGPRTFRKLAEATFDTSTGGWTIVNDISGESLGFASMGIFRPVVKTQNSSNESVTPSTPGRIFTAGTTDWGRGFAISSLPLIKIAKNVLENLSKKNDNFLDNSFVPVFQYLPFTVNWDQAPTDEWRFYYSGSLDIASGWHTDGVAFFARGVEESDSTLLYQYHRVVNGTWYYRYTLSPSKPDNWEPEEHSTGLYVFKSQQPGTVPIYQYVSKDQLRYFYSPDKNQTLAGLTLDDTFPPFYAYHFG